MCLLHCIVLERMKPIAVASFHEHVQKMHVDSDKGFESEYKVSSYSAVSYSVIVESYDSLYRCKLRATVLLQRQKITNRRTDSLTYFLVSYCHM